MRLDKTDRLYALLAVACLAGCAAAPVKVAPAGDDAYHLSVAGARLDSQAATNLKALSSAADYCAQMGKQLLFRSSDESGEHAWSIKREDLTFVCMSGGDPSYLHAGLKREHDPPVVAQQ